MQFIGRTYDASGLNRIKLRRYNLRCTTILSCPYTPFFFPPFLFLLFSSSSMFSLSLRNPLASPCPSPSTSPLIAFATPRLIPLSPNLPELIFDPVLRVLSRLALLGLRLRKIGVLGVAGRETSVPATSSEDHQPSGREVVVCAVSWDAFREGTGDSAVVVGERSVIFGRVTGLCEDWRRWSVADALLGFGCGRRDVRGDCEWELEAPSRAT
jgi:hypothetical protein